MTSAVSATFLAGLNADRSVFPHQYNPQQDQILLVNIPAATQEAASFLDERILTPQTQGAWFAVDAVATAAENLAKKPQGYIFHMGHCGSTLISRLVGAATGGCAMREPLPLRAFAMDKAEGAGAFLGARDMSLRLGLFERLWARGERPAVIKATSICTALIDDVGDQASSVFLYQKPETHLAVLLAGANAAADLRGFAQMRYRRAAHVFDLPPLGGFCLGRLAALTWLCEADAAMSAKRKVEFFDFDDFLAAPASSLGSIAGALGFEITPENAARALNGPIMRTYSKAPEHPYDPALRRKIISQAKANHGAMIAAGMDWLNGLAAKNDRASTLLTRFG